MLVEEMEKSKLQTGGEVATGEGMEEEVNEGQRLVLATARGIAGGEIVDEGVPVRGGEDGEGRLLLHRWRSRKLRGECLIWFWFSGWLVIREKGMGP